MEWKNEKEKIKYLVNLRGKRKGFGWFMNGEQKLTFRALILGMLFCIDTCRMGKHF